MEPLSKAVCVLFSRKVLCVQNLKALALWIPWTLWIRAEQRPKPNSLALLLQINQQESDCDGTGGSDNGIEGGDTGDQHKVNPNQED